MTAFKTTEFSNWMGFSAMNECQQPWGFRHPTDSHRQSLYLFSSAERASEAVLSLGQTSVDIRAFTVAQFVKIFSHLINDTAVAVFAETPHQLWQLNPSNQVPDGFLTIGNKTDNLFDALQARGFGEGPRLVRDWERPLPHRYALADNGRLVSALESQEYQTLWNRSIIPLESLGGVVAPLEDRRHGKTFELIQKVLASMRERHTPLSAITSPFSYPFYRRTGWEYTYRRAQWTIPPNLLLGIASAQGRLRHYPYMPHTRAIPVELAVIYSLSLFPQYQGYARRTADQWRTRLSHDLTNIYIWDGPQGPSGYMIVSVDTPRIIIRELVAEDDNALAGLLSSLGSLDSQTDTLVIDALPHYRLDRWVTEPDRARCELKPEGMFRIVDVKQAFEQRRWPWRGQGAAKLIVTDEMCPWNAGVWNFQWDNGRAAVDPAQDTDNAGVVDIRALGLIYAGAVTAADAVRFYGARLSNIQIRLLNQACGGLQPLLLEWF